jgi:hypothetical protein
MMLNAIWTVRRGAIAQYAVSLSSTAEQLHWANITFDLLGVRSQGSPAIGPFTGRQHNLSRSGWAELSEVYMQGGSLNYMSMPPIPARSTRCWLVNLIDWIWSQSLWPAANPSSSPIAFAQRCDLSTIGTIPIRPRYSKETT